MRDCKKTGKGNSHLKSKYEFFIGTYTDETTSKGIYRLTFDTDNQKLTVTEAAEIRNPSCLCVLDEILYAGSEYQGGAIVTAYQQNDGALRPITQKSLDGSGLCHLFAQKKTNTVLASCFLSGNSFILQHEALTVLSELSMTARMNKEPWAHCAVCDSAGERLAIADMGGDRIYLCALKNGVIDGVPSSYDMESGSGPRHLVFHPKLNLLYVTNELNSTVSTVSFDAKEGRFRLEQSLAAGEAKKGTKNYPAAISITANGRYIIISNRGFDTVCVYSVSSDGLLKQAGEYPCYGKWPRHILLTNDMQYLVISNQYSNTVAICPFNLSTGSICPPVCTADIPASSCAVEI